MRKSTQSGRSMLEMLAVLAITGLLIVGGIFLFSNLFKYYQDNETTKEMQELVTRYRSDRLTRRKNGRVVMKDLMPGSKTSGDTLTTANNGTLQLEDNGDKGTFVIIGKDLGFSCQDILLQGNYDGVLDEGEEVLSADEIKKKNIEQLKALCKREELKFLFNREGEECNYYIDGECSECKSGEAMALLPEGGNGCCRTGSINECGYCEKCPDHKQCDSKTKRCGECIDDNDCPGKQVCDNGVCVECTDDSDCQAVDAHCTSLRKCEICDTRFQEWRNGICVCKTIRPKLNEACSEECGCQGSLDCVNGTCQEGQCINEPEKTHWNGKECVCPAPKIWYNEGKCNCPLGTTEQGGDCVLTAGTTCPNLGKGDACSNYSAFPNNCCGVGLSCRNGSCQCNAIPTTYGAECSVECGCGIISGFECNAATNKCDCPAGKTYNPTTQSCDESNCPEEGAGICKKCENQVWVNDSEKEIGKCKCDAGVLIPTNEAERTCNTCSDDGTLIPETNGSHSENGKCCIDGTLKEDGGAGICLNCSEQPVERCDIEQNTYYANNCPKEIKFDCPEETPLCVGQNHCCPRTAPYWTGTKCACDPKTSPQGEHVDLNTCACEEGYVAEDHYKDGIIKCYPKCTSSIKEAGVVFLFDESPTLNHTINGTTVLSQIQKAITETEIPNNTPYAIYVTDTATPKASYSNYGSNAKAVSVANALSPHGQTGFHFALEAIANNVCKSNKRLLLLMFTDGKLNNGDLDRNANGSFKNATWNDVKKKCAPGSEMYIMSWDEEDLTYNWHPNKIFDLGETKKMNQAIANYMTENYCVK